MAAPLRPGGDSVHARFVSLAAEKTFEGSEHHVPKRLEFAGGKTARRTGNHMSSDRSGNTGGDDESIQVYSWPTPNGHKVHIMLEECDLPYRVHAVDIGAGAQFEPAFLAVSPNNRIPAIVDPAGPDGEPISIFESGACLLYLAEKTGLLMPDTARGKYQVMQWLMFQMAGVGPMLGQAHHFRIYAPEKIDYAIDRYTREAKRLYGVMNKRLGESRYIAGDDYSIADIAIFPWLRSWQNQGIDWADHPQLKAWFDAIAERPAVQRGVAVLAAERRPLLDDKARDALFGAMQDRPR